MRRSKLTATLILATVLVFTVLSLRISAAPDQEPAARIDLTASYTTPLCPGSEISYKIVLGNEAPAGGAALPASIRDAIPAGTSYVQGSAIGGGTYDPAGNSITWDGRLGPGATQVVEFKVLVGSAVANGSVIANLAVGMVGDARVQDSSNDVVNCVTPTPTVTPTQPVIVFPTSTPTPTATNTPPVIGFPTSTPTPPIFTIPKVDIDITAIEVSQGIQNLANDMPLVKDRRTIVRVYVRELKGKNVSGIRARLYGERNGQPLPGSPLSPRNDTPKHAITVRTDGGDRVNLNDSFWFTLPAEWRAGTVSLRAIVNYNLKAPEDNLTNNEKTVVVTFHTAYTFNAIIVPVHAHPNGNRDNGTKIFWGTESYRWDLFNNMYRLHPIADLDVWRFEESLKPWPHWKSNEWDLRKNGQRSQLLSRIGWKNFWTKDHVSRLHYVGGVHQDIPSDGALGKGRTNGDLNAWAKMINGNSGWDNTPWYITGGNSMAHEMGHNEKRLHVNCSGGEEDGGAVDDGYPWPNPNCSLAEVDPAGYYGLDVYYGKWGMDAPIVISNDPGASEPNRGFPMMGYQRPRWIDPYTYCALLDRYNVDCDLNLGAASMAAAGPSIWPGADEAITAMQQAEALVAVSGLINLDDGQGSIDDLALQPHDDVFADNIVQAQANLRAMQAGDLTPFALEVQDAAGATLEHRPLAFGDSETSDISSYLELLPWPPNAARIVLLHNAQILATATPSARPPTVTLISPNGGETLAPGFEIRWEASDPDDDALYFHVLYSVDGGASWKALALGVEGTSYSLEDGVALTGSEQGKFRVVALDGFHTAWDESDGVFTAPGNKPQVAILNPAGDSEHRIDDYLTLDGAGEDLEDGPLAGAALVWRSDVNGRLGEGSELMLAPGALDFGPHTITLTATDSDGQSAKAAVEIVIRPLEMYLPLTLH